jgi:hypothetical protein
MVEINSLPLAIIARTQPADDVPSIANPYTTQEMNLSMANY